MSGIPIVSFIGYSGSGKTTFIEGIIPHLRARRIRIAVIKHDSHGFEMDHEGKDTWKFSRAGAELVAISSAKKAAILLNRELSLDELISDLRDIDFIITEGYKTEGLPKIEVHRAATGKPMYEQADRLLALVTDVPIQTSTRVFGLNDHAQAAEFLVDMCK